MKCMAKLRTILPQVFYYLLAGYFFSAFCIDVGVPPSKPLTINNGSYLALSLFLFILPESRKLKLGKLFEYEARVNEIKEDVKQFKEDTRSILSISTNLISTISNSANQTVSVHLPGRNEITQANNALNSTLQTEVEESQINNKIEQFLCSEGNDLNYGLVKLRMQLEKELRRILEKPGKSELALSGNIKFFSARSLFLQFISNYPNYQGIESSYDYVLNVCNAAIHGQYIPEKMVYEAFSMGIRILNELETIKNTE